MLWEGWPDGQFYEKTTSVCLTCNSDCKYHWGYQESWFDCPTDFYFDLELLDWVSDCSYPKFVLLDNKFRGKPFWRSTEYYVNPNSLQLLELGTKEYPYKDVNLAFLEVYNIHSNSARDIIISVMENTENYFKSHFLMIINTTSVKVESYSEYYPDDPKKANFIVTDLPLNLTTVRTHFNIMNDTSKKGKPIITQ